MIIAQDTSENGEVVLREGAAGYEIIVDGQFLMSSCSGGSSVALIELGLARQDPGKRLTVLIAGLGLGFSLQAALHDSRVSAVTVVELESHIITWHEQGLIPGTVNLVKDPRTRVIQRNFLDYLRTQKERFDLIALDIDNGPDWLSHPDNASLYSPETLAIVKSLLQPDGVLTIWSADPAPQLQCNLKKILGNVTEETVPDSDGAGRPIKAFIYLCLKKNRN